MKKTILLLVVSVLFFACGQPAGEKKDKTNTTDITTAKTSKHINIPGTRLYIIPPPGFKTATTFMGLQKNESAMIQVYDLVGGNYYSNAKTYSKEEFEKKGAKVFEYKEFRLNEFPAKYLFAQGDPSNKAISIVFGDSTFSVMIMALYPASDDKTGNEIKEAIKSIYYDKNLKVDPFAAAAFTLDDSKSVFKFSKSASGLFMYSIGGVDNESAGDDPFVTVTTIPKDQLTDAHMLADMFISKLEKYGLTDKKIKAISSDNINGYPAYEETMYGNLKGKACVIYQLVVTGKDEAICIQGMVNPGTPSYLEEIKKLAKTVRLK